MSGRAPKGASAKSMTSVCVNFAQIGIPDLPLSRQCGMTQREET
jgi:hypothetical protein